MELGPVLPCLSHVDNSGWAVFLIHYNWIKEKTACLSLSSGLWLIWLHYICWRYKWSCTCHVLILIAACAASPYHLCPLSSKWEVAGSLSCPRGCHQTCQPWIWLWLNAIMNTEEIQLASLSEAINTVYHKKTILTGGKSGIWKGRYALQNAFVPWPKSSTYLIFKDRTANSPGTFQDLC